MLMDMPIISINCDNRLTMHCYLIIIGKRLHSSYQLITCFQWKTFLCLVVFFHVILPPCHITFQLTTYILLLFGSFHLKQNKRVVHLFTIKGALAQPNAPNTIYRTAYNTNVPKLYTSHYDVIGKNLVRWAQH